jgi:hypothetical protein
MKRSGMEALGLFRRRKMLTNQKDKTIERERIKSYRYLIKEYELIKAKKHSQFMFVTDFYKLHGLKRQTFIKYYHRFKQEPYNRSLLPEKRGPRYKTRRPIRFVENKVIELRKRGNNRYEINAILKPLLKNSTPSPSGIYHILKRYKLNIMTPKIKQAKRTIIKEKAGELAHIDCHYLSPGLLIDNSKRYYLVCVLDDCTRVAWAEVVEDIKSITVMFSVLRCFNMINDQFQIKFERVLTDNGPEFGQGPNKKNGDTNPFKRMLKEMGVKQSFTKPYRPQTNGKVERFWKTLKLDLLEDSLFEDFEDLKQELLDYLVYYNEHRQHQALDLKTPAVFNQFCQRIT